MEIEMFTVTLAITSFITLGYFIVYTFFSKPDAE